MVGQHGWKSHRHRGNIGGVVETRHGVSSRVLLGSRLVVLGARPIEKGMFPDVLKSYEFENKLSCLM